MAKDTCIQKAYEYSPSSWAECWACKQAAHTAKTDAATRLETYLHQQEGPSKALPFDLHMDENKQQGQQAASQVCILLRITSSKTTCNCIHLDARMHSTEALTAAQIPTHACSHPACLH